MRRQWVGLCLMGASCAFAGGAAVIASQDAGAAKTIVPAETEGVRGGQWVFLDENGNRITPPPGALPARPKATRVDPEVKANTAVEGGGFAVDLSHIRANSTAHIENDALHVDCRTSHSHGEKE
jgi:hypothetical protein